MKRSESSERHIANKNSLVGGGKSGQESSRTHRDDRAVMSSTVPSERKRKTTWHCWNAELILSPIWALNITALKLSQSDYGFFRQDPLLRNTYSQSAMPKHHKNLNNLPFSLHSSGGLAFFASRGSSHDVVFVLWLKRKEITLNRHILKGIKFIP